MLFLNVCENSNFLSVILFSKRLIEILSMIVPMILIIMVSIDLGKIVMGNEKAVPKSLKSVVSRTIAAVVVFFIPTFVSLLLSLLGRTDFKVSDCWTNANNSSIATFKAVEDAEKILEKEKKLEEQKLAEEERKKIEELREELRQKNYDLYVKYKDLKGGKMLGDVVYYNQGDYRAYPYGSYGTIASHGCGPTSAAVITSTFLGTEGHSPVDTTKWICDHGGCTSDGSYVGTCVNYMKNEGLNVEGPYGWSEEDIELIMRKLATGDYLAFIWVQNNTGRNVFTSGGHYFVLIGVENGEFRIAQVSREWQNEKTWPISSFTGDVNRVYLVSKYANGDE